MKRSVGARAVSASSTSVMMRAIVLFSDVFGVTKRVLQLKENEGGALRWKVQVGG